MYSTLQEAGISPAKRVLIGERWQILLLDSQVFGVPHGELSDFQLEWLEKRLAEALNEYVAAAAPSSSAFGL
jgi:Icc protein